MQHKLAVIALVVVLLASSAQASIGQDGTRPSFADMPVDIAKLPTDVRLGFSQGTQPVLVIHCYFGARPGDPSFGFTTDNQWNSILLTTNSPKSSMRDYYREVSYWPSTTGLDLIAAAETSYNDNSGVVHVRIDTVHPYHKGGGNNWINAAPYQILGISPPGGYSLGQFIAYLALMFADPRGDIHYDAFDTNSDGRITPDELHIIVVIAGFEASYGGTAPAPRTWRHRWALPGNGITLDGKLISGANYSGGYSMVGELTPTSTLIGMGLVCHEVGHDLGLPDLYDTDGGSEGLGEWCTMSSGDWLGNPAAVKPAHLCAWAKIDKGWLTPTTVTTNNFYTVKKVETDAQCYKLQATANEYFLVENRRQVLFDTSL
ncbi:MAG: M6 family metalloprotease domain-containing protein, partial [candidate division WOR-3 bacterium]|nr:M6 family metalloprotease domain-containing protein [candidate division WOR-3 bacterium]